MSTFASADDILDFAISNEREARHFYLGLAAEAQQGDLAAIFTELANLCEDPVLRYTFLGLASQEAGHKLKLELEYDDHVLSEN